MLLMLRKNLLILRIARPSDLLTRCVLLIFADRLAFVISDVIVDLGSSGEKNNGTASDAVLAFDARVDERRSTSLILVLGDSGTMTGDDSIASIPFTFSILVIDCRQSGQVSKVSTQRISSS
jgi:hypothetical protein